MINIFSYLDYREFIDDFYLQKKSANPRFSFQVLAAQAGFRSKSYIKLVIDGKKNLSEASVDRLNRAMKLGEKQFEYFKELVAFNQAKTLQLRNFHFEKLLSYNKRNTARLLLLQQYDYFTQWYHATIRELVCNVDFGEDYEKLGRLVKPSIPARKAKASVELLLKLGLIKKKGKLFEQTDATISTGDEVRSLAVQNFHLQNLALAGESISTSQSCDRDISCLVVGMSDEEFSKVKNEIQLFRKKLLGMLNDDSRKRRTHHISFQLFPTSERLYE